MTSASFVQKLVLKNTAYLAVSHIISKIIGLATIIFIARSLGPQVFGQYKTILAIIGMFTLFTDFGMDRIIIRETAKDVKLLKENLERFIPIRLYLSIGAFLLLLITGLFLQRNLYPFGLLIIGGLTLIFDSVANGISLIFIIVQKMQYKAIYEVLHKIILSFLVLVFFYSIGRLVSVILAFCLASFFAVIPLYCYSKKFCKFKFSLRLDFHFFKMIFRPAFWFALASFTALLFAKIDTIMVAQLADFNEAGFYATAWDVVSLFLYGAGSLYIALFPLTSQRVSMEYFKKLFGKIVFLSFGGVILAAITNMLSVPILTMLFGERYLKAAFVLNILIWTFPITIFEIWISQIYDSTNNQKMHVFTGGIFVIINICLNFLFIPRFGARGAAAASLFACLVSLFFGVPIAIKIMNNIKYIPAISPEKNHT